MTLLSLTLSSQEADKSSSLASAEDLLPSERESLPGNNDVLYKGSPNLTQNLKEKNYSKSSENIFFDSLEENFSSVSINKNKQTKIFLYQKFFVNDTLKEKLQKQLNATVRILAGSEIIKIIVFTTN